MQTSTPIKLVVFFLLLLGSFSAAQAQTQFTERKGGHSYTMEIPSYMVKTYELNDVASLQYFNKNKEAYTIVIEDSKDELELRGMKFENATDFLESFAADYKKEEKRRKLSKTKSFESNGNRLAQNELKWTDEDGDFFMLITAVETKTHFYKVICWTLAANAPQLQDDFRHLSASIKD
ncbi:hypothetical protein K3G39_12560 [Pontibacter sp. HSC-14F20]|uniref:hypothetical protein n=1 Tax=Pontibacter sp. HSC-14F20 TaxID=2864136 RepID=UPI001C731D98|nr:hypothetical protein [Pontibacter sp. HSC-14F20]MBX0334071.1 hypothetical protein [Pontibacter sp. HSC-14F20]